MSEVDTYQLLGLGPQTIDVRRIAGRSVFTGQARCAPLFGVVRSQGDHARTINSIGNTTQIALHKPSVTVGRHATSRARSLVLSRSLSRSIKPHTEAEMRVSP